MQIWLVTNTRREHISFLRVMFYASLLSLAFGAGIAIGIVASLETVVGRLHSITLENSDLVGQVKVENASLRVTVEDYNRKLAQCGKSKQQGIGGQ